ncbi:leucine-rich repeat-containing protein 9 [Antennarius striatus]|uniref:leucine-rich repeat-containing protein 9 n=1 Tax=Antennarius striatus TaxID=241820 RepID=UPI0035B1D341
MIRLRSKQRQLPDKQLIKELCEANEVSYTNIAEEGNTVVSIEMFLHGFPRMVGLSFFTTLSQLTIVGQDIEHIEALESCQELQELWVAECCLTRISGLQNCLQLQKLYLYDNNIFEITNLESQVNLKVLWLNNNRISEIKGLNTLKNLKELNLADNYIEKCGHSLDSNTSLENLNLSGNKISSFQEITMLANLPHLTELALNDPMSPPNPVCLLRNYATHVLYHIPGLRRLDTHDVSSKQIKEAAESTVMTNLMYYSMRMRTARRNFESTQLSLMDRKKSLLRVSEECIRRLSHTLKSLERELSKLSRVCKTSANKSDDRSSQLVEGLADGRDEINTTHDAAMEDQIHCKTEALKKSLVLWNSRLNKIEAEHKQDLILARNMMDYTVQFLLMELKSVENICLKEGCSTDPWYTSCCNLLLSRFCHSDFRVHKISGLKIKRIFRIQNNVLRLRFDDKLHSILVRKDRGNISQNYKHQMQYLFHMSDPEKSHQKEELLSILEEGFQTPGPFKSLDKGGAIPLTNSLSKIDLPRIEHAMRQASKGRSKQSAEHTISFRHSQIIVSKVYLGNSTPVREGKPFYRMSYPTVDSVYCDLDIRQQTALGEGGSYSLRQHTGLCHQRQWFVFDHELVLPEYIIYFEYITKSQEQSVLWNLIIEKDNTPSIDIDMEVLNMEPVLKTQPKYLSINEEIMLNVAQANVLSQITVLNLHGNSLSKIKEISHLRALQHLTISFNEFTCLDDISHMPNLEFLDASFNQLVTLEGLRALGKLKELDVCWNKLSKAREESIVLGKQAPALLKLNAKHNPWKRPEEVRETILGHLTTLTHLDDMMVTEEESSNAVQMVARAMINQACLLTHSRTNSHRPRNLSLLSGAQLLCNLSPAPWSLNKELESDWTAKITALSLDNQRISKLDNLKMLINLRWASFNDNDISKVEGLDNCLKLEELSFNNNSISTLSGLPKLHYLTKLSVDGNLLSSLEESVLGHLPKLSFLSVENNCISSLNGIKRLLSLRELYIGYNNISVSQDICYLKCLKDLIILDLCGNPLSTKLKNYELYVIFQLPFLRALDGIEVDTNKSESAKLMFEGRLIPDIVAQTLGHSNFSDLTYLSLKCCSIRTVDLDPSDIFNSLYCVNLDHNNLTSFSGLIYLPNIQGLSLNHNHIESIFPSQKTHLTKTQKMYSNIPSSGYGKQSSSNGKGETWPNCSLEPLMSSLEILYLSYNGISNMANLQLSRLTNLKVLFLQGNDISHVEGLEGLGQLRKLVLDTNRINVLAHNSLVNQTALLELHLAENRIRELSHLDSLTELRKLFVNVNKLQDIEQLNKLDALPLLTVLSVAGNPVAKSSLYRSKVVLRLSKLQVLDGVTITLEERTRAELLLTKSPQCHQCSPASLPSTDINPLGITPLMPRYVPLRGINGGGGLQNSPDKTDEAHKNKHSNATLNGQTAVNFRHTQKPENSLKTTDILLAGNKVIVTCPKQEQNNKFPRSAKPSPCSGQKRRT